MKGKDKVMFSCWGISYTSNSDEGFSPYVGRSRRARRGIGFTS